MKIKKLTAFSLAAVFFCSVSAFGAEAYVKLNGKEINFEDQKAEIINGRTLVPLRGVFDNMGFKVSWNEETRSAEIKNNSLEITMTENINRIMVNGDSVEIDVAPQIINNRLMIPLRAVAESSQAQIDWDNDTKTASVFYNSRKNVDESIDNIGISEQDYLQELISIMRDFREAASPLHDAVLFNILNLGNYDASTSIPVSEEEFSVLDEYLSKLTALQAPETLSGVDRYVKEYVQLVIELVLYSQNHNPKNTYDRGDSNFMTTMELYEMRLEELNSKFGNDLFKYFLDNKVYFEGIYGEYVLDLLLK